MRTTVGFEVQPASHFITGKLKARSIRSRSEITPPDLGTSLSGDRVHQPRYIGVVVTENPELEPLVDVFFA